MNAAIRPIEFGQRVAGLLADCGLPTEDLSASSHVTFFGLGPEPLQGVVALEAAGPFALLRSLAVAAEYRGLGLGKILVAHAEAIAAERGVPEIYLLTTTARDFFVGIGYQDVPRSSAPGAISALPQFSTLCPSSATFMVKRRIGQRDRS